MKKVTSIHIGGRVIPIEDAAYQELQSYIEGLQGQLVDEENAEARLEELEKQIAGLLDSKIRKGATSITELDILDLAESKPRVEDYARAEPSTQTPAQETHRLHRDANDKILGGVCSGIAHFFKIDPTIVRLIAAIFALSGWGILLYLLLWIIVPARELEPYVGRRVHRNQGHKIIAGVASGIADYFNIDVTIVRLVFVAPFLLNLVFGAINWPFMVFGFWFPGFILGSLVGPFVVAYIVLWIVLPVAPPGAPKGPSANKPAESGTIRNTDNSRVTRTSIGLGSAIGFVIKFFFVVIAAVIALSIFASLFAFLVAGISLWPLTNFLWTSQWQQLAFLGTLILFLGLPVFAFLVWLIRRIVGVKPGSSALRWSFSLLWTVGWISAIFFIASVVNDLRYYESSPPVDVPMAVQPASGRLLVTVTEPALEFTEHYWWMDTDATGWNLSDDSLKLSFVKFNISPSYDGQYHASIKKFSAGKTRSDARNRAAKIAFAAAYSNGILDLGNGFAVADEHKYRGQLVEIDISVPVGKKIRFDDSVTEKLNPVNISVHQGKGFRKGISVNIEDDDAFVWDTDTDYVMSPSGELSYAK